MTTRQIIVILIALTSWPALANEPREARIRDCLCNGLDRELQVPGGGRADCASATHAIEVESTRKWAEAIGQSLYYALETKKRAAIYLYCEEGEAQCLAHRLRLETTISHYRLPIDVRLFEEREVLRACPVPAR